MKLYIDDIRNAPDDSWTVARTVLSAIRAIKMFDFDEISLDHDISHQVVVGRLSRPYPCEETFEAVAHYIALKYWHLTPMNHDGSSGNSGSAGYNIPRKNIYPKITIHSSNPIGADKMKSIFDEVEIPCTIKLTGAVNRLEMEV